MKRAAIALAVLGAGLAVAVVLTTPWRVMPSDAPDVPADPARDFAPPEIARADAFDAAISLPAYASLVISLVFAAILVFTPVGDRVLGRLKGPWPVRVVLGVVGVTLAGRLITLPLAVWAEVILRRYGLSTQTWPSWTMDLLKGLAINVVLLTVLLGGIVALARRWPRSWWFPAAVGGFVLTVAVSFAYPVLVEPVFNDFRPMTAGPLRSDLMAMARADGVPVTDVLVADASRRTTAVNAYVSGFGSTRRIVVYDTLLAKATPAEVELVVAHELGHAKQDDVLYGTLAGGLAVAVGACLLFVVLRRRKPGPREIALLIGLMTLFNTVGGPAQNLISRHIEARADLHSLDLTRDPATFIAAERRLAIQNISDLSPNWFEYAMYASHPTAPQRIAMARSWARLHGVPPP